MEGGASQISGPPSLGLFDAYGVELEYMIVGAADLDVRPVADALLRAEAGTTVNEVVRDGIGWSNELVLHVVELKTAEPVGALGGLAGRFQRQVRDVNARLEPMGARLLPGAMHPWMDPDRETVLWPHGHSEVYAAFDRVFGAKGHGFANLQSAHLNLPFQGDLEFGRLHAAVRLVLPLLPAISASSPVADGRVTGALDTRLSNYKVNQRAIPSISGDVIPEPIWTVADYRALLERMYRDIRPLDPLGTLQHEWLNSRGAIARLERGSIEVRTLDVQEHPAADLAVITALVAALRDLVAERDRPLVEQQAVATSRLVAPWQRAVREGGATRIDDAGYLALFGYPRTTATLDELWRHLVNRAWPTGVEPEVVRARDTIMEHGCLAARLVDALGPPPHPRTALREVWSELAACLAAGRSFEAHG